MRPPDAGGDDFIVDADGGEEGEGDPPSRSVAGIAFWLDGCANAGPGG